jgi:hypothetical protein
MGSTEIIDLLDDRVAVALEALRCLHHFYQRAFDSQRQLAFIHGLATKGASSLDRSGLE